MSNAAFRDLNDEICAASTPIRRGRVRGSNDKRFDKPHRLSIDPMTNRWFYFSHFLYLPDAASSGSLSFMDGAIHSEHDRPLVRTGPIELRDVGPNGRPLGTPEDCTEDSRWELHRGELVETPMAHDIHAIVMVLLSALFHLHVRRGYSVLSDIHCVLDDAFGQSRRAPDVAIAHEVTNPKGDALYGTPVLAVEIRATQSRKYLEEKVKLYIEHDWPTVWIVHTERHEVEVVRKGLASVVYRPGTSVPLVPELDTYGLTSLPVTAFFDERLAPQYTHEWVRDKGIALGVMQGMSASLLTGLMARGWDVPAAVRRQISSSTDSDQLQRWLKLAFTATNAEEFIKGMA